jgi:hypothetical protein
MDIYSMMNSIASGNVNNPNLVIFIAGILVGSLIGANGILLLATCFLCYNYNNEIQKFLSDNGLILSNARK